MSRHAASGPPPARPAAAVVSTVLVVAAVAFILYVPLYARISPRIGDFPFFYFYLLAYLPVLSVALLVVIALSPGRRRGGADSGQEP